MFYKYLFGKGYRRKIYNLLDRVIFRHIHLRKTFIFYDRSRYEAGDNAEALFRYLNLKNPQGFRFYFILEKNSADYSRVNSFGKIVQPMSLKHWFLHCCCKYIVTSHPENKFFVKKKETVFLQHGVTLNDVSRVYNAKKVPLVYFVAATKKEYQSLLGENYGYGKDVVKLTGFPRWDFLENNPRKIITFSFTWRSHIQSHGKLVPNIEDTEYYKILQSIFTDSKIFDLAESYGYEVQVKLHPRIQKFANILLKNHDDRLHILDNKIPYSQIISKSALLVTDYSSIMFDFAYLGKPVICYQEDFESFFSGTHTVNQGYFDYERDGFGEVIKNKADLLSVLEKYMKNNCAITEFYKERIRAELTYTDKNNCERVWNIIKA